MPMLCLAGTFRIVGSEPDGDSIRFYPDDPSHWSLVPGPPAVHTNASGGAQLRLDAIDALETHYAPQGSGPLHQPLTFAHQAAGELLRWLGFRSVTREGEKVVAVADDGRPGFILTRGADRYGRCVALVGRGEPPAQNATDVQVNVALLRKTANYRLITTGLAYPTFYFRLFPDLRSELARQAQKARPRTGLQADDLTQKGFSLASLATLTDDVVILPKLFRRLVDYLALNDEDPSLAGFSAYLGQRDDRILILSTGHYTGFDYVVKVDGQTVKLTVAPEDLLFQEA
jgi:hypothetical protein